MPGRSATSAVQIATLIANVQKGAINGKTAKSLFEELWNAADLNRDVDDLIREQGLAQVSDPNELKQLVRDIVAANPEQAAQFRAGKEKIFAFFVGQAMKATKGRANPAQLNALLRDALTEN
jgi:aspartyl-tRNA(Asn)/glutamyl-tRNA(Gln) amidotransferase subunit B